MSLKRFIVGLLTLLMMANAPSFAGCTDRNASGSSHADMPMAGMDHGKASGSQHEMPCKQAPPQCSDGTGCLVLVALPQPALTVTPTYQRAVPGIPDPVFGTSLSIAPAIPPPIAIV